jgi:tetratricopeptide (TPR) repeat protein
MPIQFGVRPFAFPEGAVAFLERHGLDGRVFNSYHYGGYLIWRRWPANQVFIDGRYDTILFDEGLLEEYFEAHESPEALDRLTAAYDVDVLVLDAHPDRYLAHLGQHPAWARVYWDSVAEVLVRRGGRFADLIAAHEYQLIRPSAGSGYLAAYRADPKIWHLALEELRRAVAENPENRAAWLALAQEYRAAGPPRLSDRLEALTRSATLLAGSPALGRVHGERADALFQLGRIEEAEAAAHTALRLDRESLLPRWILAAIAERRSAWEQAREHLGAILVRLEPGDLRIRQVQARLQEVERHLRGLSGS